MSACGAVKMTNKVISIKLGSVTEGVRSDEGDTGSGGTKSDSETVDEQIEKKGRKNSALRNARVDPRGRKQSHQDGPGTGYHRGKLRTSATGAT